MRWRSGAASAGLALTLVVLGLSGALAQAAHHPFAIGASEGAAGPVSGLSAWILAQESGFYRLLTGAIRAAKDDGSAFWGLASLSFAYGVFHAAGPGHGKAVIASYMVSNERALWRGLVIALFAAVLQGLVAVGIVGIAAIVFHATAQRMTAAANVLEIMSYVGIAGLGAVLLWRKGSACVAFARQMGALERVFASQPLAFGTAQAQSGRFLADDGGDHVHDSTCGHFHGLDPSRLDQGFAWKSALLTVATAGARPCSGAILVLVFALAQGIFAVGVGATFAMSLGTAITTGALAASAVFAKTLALRLSGPSSPRAVLVGHLVEVAAALCVMGLGLILLTATLGGAGVGA